MNRTAVVRRATLAGLVAAGLIALGALPASAHVTITPSTTTAGATAVLRVEVPHGCDGSATTAISVRMPDGVTDVTASGTDRWAVDRTADGLTFTTDAPLPDGEHAEVEFSVRLPDDAGATLVFPVVQQCEVGDAAWTEVAEHGEGHDALDRPAPVVVVTPGDAEAASADGGASEVEEQAEVEERAEEEPDVEVEDEGRDQMVYGAAGLLVAGGLAGGAVLLRHRRRR